MITVLADQYLYKLSAFLPEDIHLVQFDPQDGLPESLDGVNALLIRTVTPINDQTLPDIPDSLQFIATGSAGTDHVDREYLTRNNITFTSAAGCNARSVAEYVATTLLLWADEHDKDITEYTAGIIGAGHVGSAVQKLLEQLTVSVIVYDPPREYREPGFTSAGLQEVLQADILTFHTPLTDQGPHPTYYWLDTDKLLNHSFDLVINTSRGGVIHEAALLQAFSDKRVGNMIIDVWENEPFFSDELAQQAFISTPHIAGYSIQAKLNASQIICNKLNQHFGLPANYADSLSRNAINTDLPDKVNSLSDILTSVHPVLKYQESLMSLVGKPPSEKGLLFNKLRAEFPLRNEFNYLHLPSSIIQHFPALGIITS